MWRARADLTAARGKEPGVRDEGCGSRQDCSADVHHQAADDGADVWWVLRLYPMVMQRSRSCQSRRITSCARRRLLTSLYKSARRRKCTGRTASQKTSFLLSPSLSCVPATPCSRSGPLTYSLDTFFPRSPHADSLLHAPMASHFLTDQSFARQQSLLGEADGKGKVVYRGESDPKTRRMGFSLVKLNEDGVGEDETPLTEEEIFGAVLPVVPVSVS